MTELLSKGNLCFHAIIYFVHLIHCIIQRMHSQSSYSQSIAKFHIWLIYWLFLEYISHYHAQFYSFIRYFQSNVIFEHYLYKDFQYISWLTKKQGIHLLVIPYFFLISFFSFWWSEIGYIQYVKRSIFCSCKYYFFF